MLTGLNKRWLNANGQFRGILLKHKTLQPPRAPLPHALVGNASACLPSVEAPFPALHVFWSGVQVSSDWKRNKTVVHPATEKLKKKSSLTLNLEPTRDILRQVVEQRRAGTIVIGFAAETQNVREEGRRKLLTKGADLIVANDVSRIDSGFESDFNAGILISQDDEQVLPRASKREMADQILNRALSIASFRGSRL